MMIATARRVLAGSLGLAFVGTGTAAAKAERSALMLRAAEEAAANRARATGQAGALSPARRSH